MVLNRNNYETYFLLYADNELCADERTAIEEFVTYNEDLRAELKMTLAAILPPDELLFDKKETLYKNSFVDADLQELLLQKIDNELSVVEAARLSTMLVQNENAEKEHQLLLLSKLDKTETIVFKSKETLYKKEKVNAVDFSIARWAAAAILLGFGLFFGNAFFKKNRKKINESVALKIEKKKRIDNANSILVNNTNESNTAQIKKVEQLIVASQPISQQMVVEAINKQTQQKKKTLILPTNIAENKIAAIKKILPVENKKNTINTIITNPAIASIIIKEQIPKTQLPENIVPIENTYAQAVSFNEDEKSNNKIFYLDEDEIKRSKIGGIFKKLKRMVERNANIKTGNTLKIAGFEIAAK